MPTPPSLPPWSLLKKQASACAAFLVLLSIIVGSLYFQSRQREWILRQAQANHRLDATFELISREVERVGADALFLADQLAVKEFTSGNTSLRAELTNEYINFAKRKGIYDQIRLLDLNGKEKIRVNYSSELAKFVEATELQNKSDRYYFQKATSLGPDDVYVSEFDLNLEHGEIERPLKPVIRFVAPVIVEGNRVDAYLVLNYLGAELLDNIDDGQQSGITMLLRTDGHYLRGADTEDAWGWLLGHQNTFATRFPQEWKLIGEQNEYRLTANGAFAAKRISLGSTAVAIVNRNKTQESLALRTTRGEDQDAIFIVSYWPSGNVFAASNESLQRLSILAGGVFALVAVFVRPWARAVLTRQLQSRRLVESEEQLRELSSRLLQIQEDERRAISREIHDDLGQQVTAINLDLKLAERNCTSDAARPHLHRAISENESLLETLHEFARRVRPAVLDDLGLRDAIESHLSEFQHRTGIAVDSQLLFRSTEIPDNIADNTYRLLQESLTNVTKHAHATKVWVNMVLEHSPKKQFAITVQDDGRGNADPSEGHRLGLVGMRERVGLLFGEFQITADSGKGTCVEIRIPIPDQPGAPH